MEKIEETARDEDNGFVVDLQDLEIMRIKYLLKQYFRIRLKKVSLVFSKIINFDQK